MKHIALAGLIVFSATLPVRADLIERACTSSGRDTANQQLCGCIQDVADLTLSHAEQRRAARFFSDPHEAQVVRQSDRQQEEQFWLRYKSFGETAEAYCTF